ncbi:alpha/beta fold hydrolase [Actinomarinicola tropica]|uniref:Alpha/beta fold hydrolase n=1 Tax=Actinomarinicola tropica TaxID=2789776 RepID=A0A5Q2RLU7_9ACTN|nr:alpha/beta hydrolase [Actinomarinicola tropica]QGG96813.1 alpha/beta fold hydrolase [Actinomarinicola tropica]
MGRTVQHVTTDQGEIAYTDTGGDAPVALFVHGVFLNGHLWRHVIDRVAAVRRCVAVDLLGHGDTRIAADQDLSFRSQAEMLLGVCDALGLDQVDLVGNDSGGGICQIFAARHPERIRTLSLTNCDVHDNWPPAALGSIQELVAAGGLPDLGAQMLADVEVARAGFAVACEHPERLDAETVRTYLGPLFATAESTANLERWFTETHDNSQTVEIEPQLRSLTAPTLVVWGTDDVFFDVEWAHWLRDTIPGCERVVELDGAKLFFPEERPDELAVELLRLWGGAG